MTDVIQSHPATDADPVAALIAEYDRLSDLLFPLDERAVELRLSLPVYLRGPAQVSVGAEVFFTEEAIDAAYHGGFYEQDAEDVAKLRTRLRADLAAYQAAVTAAEEACGLAELDRQVEAIEERRSALYEGILETPATTFDGLAAHIRFLIDDGDCVEIILAGLDNLRRLAEPTAKRVVGFGPP
jgi:hypothetical protein